MGQSFLRRKSFLSDPRPAPHSEYSAIDCSVTIAGVRLRNPVIAASGTFGYGEEYAELAGVTQLGGICTKGLTLKPRTGNNGVRLWETPAGLLNSIGLENPGIEHFIENQLPTMKKLGPVVIANLSGSDVEEYAAGAKLLDASSVDMIELNISCPNVKQGGMSFGLQPEAALQVTEAVRKAAPHKSLMVKLSPNAPDLAAVARSCINAGADALSLVNTFKAMAVDIEQRRPVFDNVSAGLSGPAIKPIALRMVWELWEALRVGEGAGNTDPLSQNTRIPIVGMGGIASAIDAIEFLSAGAQAIQIGSATFAHPHTMIEIIGGIAAYMERKGLRTLDEICIRT
jgi:dihydroorotate dehydrogenase (NAD+) catalytic subunit